MPHPARLLVSLGILAVATATLGAYRAPAAVPQDDLDVFVTTQMERRHIDGLSLAIVQDGRVVTARAYGVTDRGEPRRVDTTTLFQAGSISKPVAALGALRLVESGKVSLDADVNTILKSWKLPASEFTATAPLTLRALLSHTGGTTVHGFPGYDVDSAVPTLVQVLDGAKPTNTAPIRSEAKPGERWKYSGGGYTIMQQLVIDATGQPFPEYMRKAVLAPLGMKRSSYEQPLPKAMAGRTAAGHYPYMGRVPGRWHLYPEMAAAGLWTTPSDLARFAIAVQRAYAGKDSAVISPAMARQMLTEVKGGYGLGPAVQWSGDSLRFSHGGRDEGFDALLLATARTGQALVIMINANDNSRFMGRLSAFIQRKYRWPGAPPEFSVPPVVAAAPERLEEAAGLYDLGGGNFVTLVARDGRLFTTSFGGLDEELVPVGPDLYASTERPVQFEVRRAPSLGVAAVIRTAPNGTRTLPRLGPLFRSAAAGGAPEATLAARADSVLRALAQGGDALKAVGGLSEGARKDFGSMRWPPITGLASVACSGSASVAAGTVSRHGAPVARLAYCRARTDRGERLIVVYYTADGLVTDVDVVDE